MRTLDEVLKNNINGLHYGNRVLLPFKADILKAVVENDIIMDFSHQRKEACYNKHDYFTEIYFFEYPSLEEVVTEFETIKLVVVEDGKDIFDFQNHRKLVLHIKENHKLIIEETNEDILFIE
ncbi:hypothetical protein [Melioribacter sp. OK-6-Me]|uniref:hypothetical protein n=1 Tax=unclassified Melioribacter TaxID=2627329 RepID=UPI003ED9DAB8